MTFEFFVPEPELTKLHR